MTRSIHLFVCIIILFLSGCKNQEATVIYVSPKGSDINTGSLDQPLLTIEKALSQVKVIREKSTSAGISIRLREGSYYLDQALLFTPELCGNKDAHLTIEAYASELPVLSGGRLLDLKWEPFQHGMYKAVLKTSPWISSG